MCPYRADLQGWYKIRLRGSGSRQGRLYDYYCVVDMGESKPKGGERGLELLYIG